MKTTAFLLAVYFLFIGAVPCCESDDCHDENTNTEQSADRHDAESHQCNTCSPFFNCDCGCVLPMLPDANSASSVVATPKKLYSDFILLELPSTHFSFWQPPRAG